MKNTSSILASSLGNILEWYDFGLFTIFSTLFSQLYFPSENPHLAIIATLSIFTVGFLCRPLGALLFGYLGDKWGRAKTLRLSILMIAIPTLLIAFIPTYQQIGIAAPILLTIIRMWQGVSLGGEFSGNIIYLAEIAPRHRRAMITSFAGVGANLGILIAGLVGIITTAAFSQAVLKQWAWRLPYLLSGAFCIFLYYFRLKLHETPVFRFLLQHQEIVRNPIKRVFKYNWREVLRTIGMVCMGSSFYYFTFVYIPIFVTEVSKTSTYFISLSMTFFLMLMIVFVPFAGRICDSIGRRYILLTTATLIMLVIIPGFYLLHFNHLYLSLFVLLLFTILSSMEQGVTLIAIVENFPSRTRYTGVSLGYNIGNGLIGGTVPIVCTWLMGMTQNLFLPPLYVALCALVTGIVVYFFVPETTGKDLV